MSVNIFGGSNKIRTDTDQKFRTLSTNLALKMNKSGDVMTGDLKILLGDDAMQRIFGASGINAGKSVILLLGDEMNLIRYNFGCALEIHAQHGVKIASSVGEMVQIGTQSDASAIFFNDVIMRDNCIKNLRDPVSEQDATTKLYVDTKCVKNSVGYVPNLITNDKNKCGFSVSASTEVGRNLAYNVFSFIGAWISSESTNFWIQVECPEPVRIHKIALRGVSTAVIRNWLLQGANHDGNWQTLIENYVDNIDHTEITFIEVDSYRKYLKYRIWINSFEGEKAGLSFWQIFTADSLV